MADVLVGAQVVVLVAMVAVSLWGQKHVEPEARIPTRLGISGLDYTMSKKATLVLTPLVGLIVLIATISADEPTRETPAALGLPLMLIFLLAHLTALRRAAR